MGPVSGRHCWALGSGSFLLLLPGSLGLWRFRSHYFEAQFASSGLEFFFSSRGSFCTLYFGTLSVSFSLGWGSGLAGHTGGRGYLFWGTFHSHAPRAGWG